MEAGWEGSHGPGDVPDRRGDPAAVHAAAARERKGLHVPAGQLRGDDHPRRVLYTIFGPHSVQMNAWYVTKGVKVLGGAVTGGGTPNGSGQDGENGSGAVNGTASRAGR